MYKKYFSEHIYYFIIFAILSFTYIVNGYASLATNDDWALRSMLVSEGIYNTFIMSYPLSYLMSHLYDFFPLFQWYSILLTLIMSLNFYLWSRYIENNNSYIQKVILFIFALLWLTFLWFNMSITILTVTTMVSAVGLIRKSLLLSFTLIFLASLLRTDIMLILVPYYLVSYVILRNSLRPNKKELFTLVVLITLIVSSLFIQKQDRFYTDWLAFNKVRSAIVDMAVMSVEKDFFTQEEWFCVVIGWWQDSELLATERILAATPTLADIIQKNLQKIHLVDFIKNYKFKHWLWLLLLGSLLVIIFHRKDRKALAIPLLVIGVALLLITRDVERVTVPLIILWAYVIIESLKSHRIIVSIFLFLFTYLFYYYASSQFGYRYFKENMTLQKEARQLINKSNKFCEISVMYPTSFTKEVNTVFEANYLYHENSWLQMNDKEILPGGWLSRHKFFYLTHHLSDAYTKRTYHTYYEYLIDDKTAFFGSKKIVKSKNYDILLQAYDKRYLKERPECKHKTFIVKKSKHFAISQIRVDCNSKNKK